ncbi:MAG: sulfotransferase [Hydrocarboniphaga sp.]|nr:sulfotransferase [Hydrocarboniphaga sp.]
MPPIKELHFFDRAFPHSSMVAKIRKDAKKARGMVNNAGTIVKSTRAAKISSWSQESKRFGRLLQSLTISREPDFAVYSSLFSFAGQKITGDITPAYSELEPSVVNAIAAHLPDVKIILMLRDPISRLWSNLNDAVGNGRLAVTVVSELAELKQTLRSGFAGSLLYPSEIHRRWAEHIPAHRFRWFFLDDVIADPQATRAAILRYLGGNPDESSGALALSHNSKDGRPRAKLEGDLLKCLIAEFEAELRACAEIFGGAALGWLQKYGLK